GQPMMRLGFHVRPIFFPPPVRRGRAMVGAAPISREPPPQPSPGVRGEEGDGRVRLCDRVIVAMVLLLAMVVGCDGEDAAPAPRRGPTTATAAAAAPEHYVPPAGTPTTARPVIDVRPAAPRPTGPLAAD